MSTLEPGLDAKVEPIDEDLLLDHAYDGIKEYDNPMPRWWVWMFWGSFWFSCAYLFHYWIGNGESVEQSYQSEMAVVNADRAKDALSQAVTEETLAQVVSDASSVTAGREVFASKCVACHMESGQGSIGPNLTDAFWIHGTGRLMDVYNVVSEGVVAKGMPAWSRQLTPAELRQVVAFVGTLRNTNIEGKAPEGQATE